MSVGTFILSEAAQTPRGRFISYWGELASNWGVSRTMAQVYALLFSSTTALDTDQIMEALSISRGNANMNLHKLVDWGLAHKVHVAGNRKDLYEAEKDVWVLTRRIIEERRRREVTPMLQAIEDVNTQLATRPGSLTEEERDLIGRMQDMAQITKLFDSFTQQALPILGMKNQEVVTDLMAHLPPTNGSH